MHISDVSYSFPPALRKDSNDVVAKELNEKLYSKSKSQEFRPRLLPLDCQPRPRLKSTEFHRSNLLNQRILGGTYDCEIPVSESNIHSNELVSLSEEREKQRLRVETESRDNLKLMYRVFSAWLTFVQFEKLIQKHQMVAEAFYYRKLLLRYYKLIKLSFTQRNQNWTAVVEMSVQRLNFNRGQRLLKTCFRGWLNYVLLERQKEAMRLKSDVFRRKRTLGKYLYAWRKEKDGLIIKKEVAANEFRVLREEMNHKSLMRKVFNNWITFVCLERKKRHLHNVMKSFQRGKMCKYFSTWHQRYQTRIYNNSLKADLFYSNSCLPKRNNGLLHLCFGAWKRYYQYREAKKNHSIIANFFFKHSILYKFFVIWKGKYRSQIDQKFKIASIFCAKKVRANQLSLQRVCFQALLRYKSKAIYTKLIYLSAQKFDTRRILTSTLKLWKRKYLDRKLETEKTFLSLWHWSSQLKRRVLLAWHKAAKKNRDERIKFSATVLQTRNALQKQLVENGVVHSRSILCMAGREFLTGYSSRCLYSSCVEKYANIWLHKWKRNKSIRSKIEASIRGSDNVLNILETSIDESEAPDLFSNTSENVASLPDLLLGYIKEKSLNDYRFDSPVVHKSSHSKLSYEREIQSRVNFSSHQCSKMAHVSTPQDQSGVSRNNKEAEDRLRNSEIDLSSSPPDIGDQSNIQTPLTNLDCQFETKGRLHELPLIKSVNEKSENDQTPQHDSHQGDTFSLPISTYQEDKLANDASEENSGNQSEPEGKLQQESFIKLSPVKLGYQNLRQEESSNPEQENSFTDQVPLTIKKPRVPDFLRGSIENLGFDLKSPLKMNADFKEHEMAENSDSCGDNCKSQSMTFNVANSCGQEDHSAIEEQSNLLLTSQNEQNVYMNSDDFMTVTEELASGFENSKQRVDINSEDLVRGSASIERDRLMRPDEFSGRLMSSTPNESYDQDYHHCNSGSIEKLTEASGDFEKLNLLPENEVSLYAEDLTSSILHKVNEQLTPRNESQEEIKSNQTFVRNTNEISTQTEMSLLHDPNVNTFAALKSQNVGQVICAKCCQAEESHEGSYSYEPTNSSYQIDGDSSNQLELQSTVNCSSLGLNTSKYSIELKRLVVKYKKLKVRSEQKREDLKRLVSDLTSGLKNLDESETKRIVELKSEIKSTNRQLKDLKNTIKNFNN